MRVIFSISLIVCAQSMIAQQQVSAALDSLPPFVYQWKNLPTQKEDEGTSRLLFNGSTTTLSSFEAKAYTLPPGGNSPANFKHDDLEELMIVKDGKFSITINGISRIVGPGSIAFVMPGDEHSIGNAGNSEATYYMLKYKGRSPDPARGTQSGGSFMLDWDDLKTNNTGKGYRRDFFNRPTSQLAQFEMHTTALNADSASHAPHTHVQEEIVLILRGNVTMHIDGKLFPASPGDVVFLPSRVPHALLNTGEEQCEYFAFQWRN
jgi:(S)-ureidoglycine aminohydrolase